MNYIEPSSHYADIENGELGNNSGRYEKKLSNMEGIYADNVAFQQAVKSGGEEIVYKVTDKHPAARHGDMIIGMTQMQPGLIGDEFYVTRGHIHATANRPETYYGESGEGLMLMESPDGQINIQELRPRVMCYVPPFWIHRTVNIGSEPLVMTFFYPADSGQDYEIIAKSGGMKSRIVADGTGWKEVPNLSYTPRSDDEIEQVLATADKED